VRVKEGEKRVSVIAHEEMRKNARPRRLKDLRGKRKKSSLSRIKTSTFTHVDDQTQQLVDFRLERERFGFFFSRHDDKY
jgi:hypothetical protein